MNAADIFKWIVIGGAVALVFIMLLWSINAMTKMMRIGRRILRRKPKRRRKTTGHY